MQVLRFALNHLARHWRLNLVVLLGFTLSAALLAGLPSYATAIAARSLKENLDDASPATRNLRVSGPTGVLNAALYGQLQDGLGDLMESRVEVRSADLLADAATTPDPVDTGRMPVQLLRVWSFDRLASIVKLVDGELPGPAVRTAGSNPLKPPPVPVAIGADAAADTGWRIGDRVTAAGEQLRLDIVAIVEPLNPEDDLWLADLSAFGIKIDASDPNVDFVTLPLLADRSALQNVIGFQEGHWRVTVNRAGITAANAANVQSRLLRLQTTVGRLRAQISTGLIEILGNYLGQLSRVRMALLLLSAQAFIFVLYTLSMLTTFSLDRSQIELATLAGRGATAWQITLMYALESLILALPAAMALGPGLALFASRLWAWVGAETVPTSLPPESWLLAAIGTACGWLAFILPVYPAARRNLLEWQQARARPVRRSVAQRLYLDLFLLGFGALLYWQLNQSQSFVMRRLGDSSLADPLLLLGPSLLIIAVALLFLRLFPFLLRIVAAVFQRTRGVAFPLSLSRLARDPLKPSRVVLLISLTASLTLFAAAFEQSLGTGQTEMAHYLAGADLRVALSGVGRDPPLKIEQVQELSGVLTASRVFRGLVQNREGRGIQLFALDPTTLHRVTRYPTSLTRLTVSSITGVLQSPAGGQPSASADQDVMPAIFSYAALPSRSGVGDELSLNLGGHRLTYGVQGTIRNFPTLDDAFVIASLPDLETRLDLGLFGVRTTGTFEAWLEVDPQQYATLIAHPLLQDRILDDAQARLHIMQGDVLAQGTSGAFQLNALTLAFLSVAGFLLVQFFASKQRLVEFGVLRAMGLSQGQLLSLLAAEGALMTLSGLAAGVVIGYGLAQVMVPFLSQALAESLAGVRITDVLIDWPGIVRLYALLIGFYTLAMLLLLILLKRVGVHRVMRIGDE